MLLQMTLLSRLWKASPKAAAAADAAASPAVPAVVRILRKLLGAVIPMAAAIVEGMWPLSPMLPLWFHESPAGTAAAGDVDPGSRPTAVLAAAALRKEVLDAATPPAAAIETLMLLPLLLPWK